jgi:tetratricopeptide (TPR) repeat protein
MPDTGQDAPRIAALERRLNSDPGSRAFVELARLYHVEGRLEEAARLCADGVRRHPEYLSARVLLGRIYFDMGFLEEARETMEYVLERAPDNLVARRVVAETFLSQGDREAALERFRALLAFRPDDDEARTRLREVEAGTPAAPPPAPAPQAILATPTLAEVYLQQGLPEEAIRLYGQILSADPGNAVAKERLASLVRSNPSLDPATLLVRRKIDMLNGWLQALRHA